MTYLGKGLSVAPDDPRLALLRAELAFSAKRVDEAKSRYLAFFAAGGDDLSARLHLAQILEQEKDVAGAVAQYEAAKKCFPPYAGAQNPWIEIARIRKADENLDGAMREIEGFVRLVETDIPHRLELADYYEGRGEDRKLADILAEITWIYPLGEKSALPVHARLGRALARLSDAEGAAMEFEVALELGVPEEERPALHVDLGDVYALLGRAKDARRQAEAALELSPDFERAKRLLETTGGK